MKVPKELTKKHKLLKNKKNKQKPLNVEDDVTHTLQNIDLKSDGRFDEPPTSETIPASKSKNKSKTKEQKTFKKEKRSKSKPRHEEEQEDAQNSDNPESGPEYSIRRSSGAEVHGGNNANDKSLSQERGVNGASTSGGDHDNDSYHSVEESDSSEDEVGPRNTVGEVPLEFYKDEDHVGYDISGQKIKKKAREDQLAKYLAKADDKKTWRKITDEYNDELVELRTKEIKTIRRILEGKTPHADMDPYAPAVDWFEWEGKGHPLSNAPEPKRRFKRSIWEHKKIIKLKRAIRERRITFDKPKEQPKFYDLWADDSGFSEKRRGLVYIPPPKMKLPGHEESYNPSLEYLPTQEELDSYQSMYEEDRPKFIPKRAIPAYPDAVKERFERNLDLYICSRVRKKHLNVDPESLKDPNRPKRQDFRPYPTTCYIEFKGHNDAVVSISTDGSGQWISSGSLDGTVRVWEVATGRCINVWEFGDAIQHVAWNPLPQLPILAVSVGQDVFLIDTGLGSEEEQKSIKDLLHMSKSDATDESGDTALANWLPDDKHGGVRVKHFKTVSSVEWHRRGDYFSAVMPAGESRGVMLHHLSKKVSKQVSFRLRGLPVSIAFHPTRSILFIATKKLVRVYDLLKEKLIKKLDTQLREVSHIAIHPGGDNVIVGSREGKWCWFDMDLSSVPYKNFKAHSKDITNVTFHRSYPLFASCSEDSVACVYHGMVYSDLNQNPYILPLIKHRGPSSKERGVLDCKFHPRQPWLFTAGSDSVIRLYCH